MEKRAAPVQFRPTQTNRAKLDLAAKLGIEMTEVMNGVLAIYGDSYLKELAKTRIQELQKMVSR